MCYNANKQTPNVSEVNVYNCDFKVNSKPPHLDYHVDGCVYV